MIDFLLDFLGAGFKLIGDLLSVMFGLLAKPLAFLLELLEGIFYFIYQLFQIVIKVLMIFVALFQFFFALVAGFFRSIYSLLTIDFYKNMPHYPSESSRGITVVVELLRPTGLMTVVPMIILAIIWGIFIKKIIGLIGGDLKADA